MNFIKRQLQYGKYRLKRFFPERFWGLLASLKKKFGRDNYLESREKIEFRNSQTEEIYYVIRRQPPGAGLFSNMNHVLQGIIYARAQGWIPIVDMENYWTTYSQKREVLNTRNSWEYFFDQSGIPDLSEIYKNRNHVLSKGNRFLATRVFNPPFSSAT